MVALSNNSSQQTPGLAGSYPGAPGLRDLPYRAAALTNSSGSIVEAYDCDAYGNTLIFTGPGADGVWFTDDDVQSNYGANEIIFCGYRYDAETQNHYVRNRTYNPVLARGLTRDPIGYSGGINLYEYLGGLAAARTAPPGKAVIGGRFVAGMGTFSVTIWSERHGNSRFRSHVEVTFSQLRSC